MSGEGAAEGVAVVDVAGLAPGVAGVAAVAGFVMGVAPGDGVVPGCGVAAGGEVVRLDGPFGNDDSRVEVCEGSGDRGESGLAGGAPGVPPAPA